MTKKRPLRADPPGIYLVLLPVFFLIFPGPAFPQSKGFRLKGMAAGWTAGRFGSSYTPAFNLRFIPEATIGFDLGGGARIDAEASVNAFASVRFPRNASPATDGDIKPYRAWLRFSTSRFEARIGLQKLNFGSASIFRPLMWFDSLDPRDPLQITDGVTGLLLRYYTKGNANFWAWGLYGNEDARGWDLAPPDRKTPEFGGRVQAPLFKGEIAATYHHRKAAIDGLVPIMGPLAPQAVAPVPEDRFGLDGKWDFEIGFWLEGALVHQKTGLLPLPYQTALSAGMDYTFGLGNGFNVLAEHFRLESSAEAFGRGSSASFSALMLRYPLGLLDELTGIFYYDWRNRDAYRFLSWRRTTDALSLNAILFWNPDALRVLPGQSGTSSFAGTGFQILLAYHF
jgi:hypothetical protein